jgi:hypothetical protein
MGSPGNEARHTTVTERLKSATAELIELEELVKSGNLDSRVLNEFRDAVDLVRCTAWAVQQWIGLQEKAGGDPYSLLPILSAQRVKRATQLTRDLTIDLESVEVGLETPGLKELFQAVDGLHERLAPLCRT